MDHTFDLDGTLCTQPHATEFGDAEPFLDRIMAVNALHDAGHRILIDTARGSRTGIDWKPFTIAQLERWGLRYTELRVGEKRGAEIYVDDKAVSPEVFFGTGPTLIDRRARAASVADFAREYFDHLHAAARQIPVVAIEALVTELESARLRNATVFLVANGGSAASAQHMANGLGAYLHRKTGDGFRLHALTENIASLTGQANDAGFECIFTDQLTAHYRPGDLLIAISCSGDSPNILRAAEFVRARGGRVIGLLGFCGGQLKELCDVSVLVRTAPGEYGPVEDAHMALCHSLVHWYQGVR